MKFWVQNVLESFQNSHLELRKSFSHMPNSWTMYIGGYFKNERINYGLHKSRKSLSLSIQGTCFTCLSVRCRARTCPAVPWHSQLPIQAWSATGSAINVPRKTWLGSVLLQGSTTWAKRPDTQESASVHRHESYWPQPGASNSCSKSHKNGISSPTIMNHHCWYPIFIIT